MIQNNDEEKIIEPKESVKNYKIRKKSRLEFIEKIKDTYIYSDSLKKNFPT